MPSVLYASIRTGGFGSTVEDPQGLWKACNQVLSSEATAYLKPYFEAFMVNRSKDESSDATVTVQAPS